MVQLSAYSTVNQKVLGSISCPMRIFRTTGMEDDPFLINRYKESWEGGSENFSGKVKMRRTDGDLSAYAHNAVA